MKEIKSIKEVIEKEIVAILPDYRLEAGNCTIIWTREGERVLLKRSIKTALKYMCNYYHLDQKASNKTYGELLSMRRFPPLPFNKDEIFISGKTRIPLMKDEGAYGYIKVSFIERAVGSKERKDMSLLYLKNGETIEVFNRIETMRRNINNGEIVRKLLEDANPLLARENPGVYLEEDSPATKKDIAMVYMKLMEIREMI